MGVLLKVIFKSFPALLCVSLMLVGCYNPRIFNYHSPGDRSCQVEVLERRAGGHCTEKNGTPVPFDLWSQSIINYEILAQGLNSNDHPLTTTHGLRINGVEQGPTDERWRQLLQNPGLLCSVACGPGEWAPSE